MAYIKDNVFVVISGEWLFAPIGTEVPTDVNTALSEDFKDLGWLAEDGFTETPISEKTQIKALQRGTTVKDVTTDSGMEYDVSVLETTPEVLELYFGAKPDPVTGALKIDPAKVRDHYVFVWHAIEVIGENKVNKVRNVIRDGQVSEVQPLTYKYGEPVTYSMKIRAYTDQEGDGVERYNVAAVAPTTEPEEEPIP